MNTKIFFYTLLACSNSLLTGCEAFYKNEKSSYRETELTSPEVRKEANSIFEEDVDSVHISRNVKSMLTNFVQSKNVEVRKSLAKGLGDIARGESDQKRQRLFSNDLLPIFKRLINDSDDEVRKEVASLIHELAHRGAFISDDFVPFIQSLLKDDNVGIRRRISSILANIYWQQSLYTNANGFHEIESIWTKDVELIKDTDPEVRRNITKLFKDIALGGSKEGKKELLGDTLRSTLIYLLEEDDLLARKNVESMLCHLASASVRDSEIRKRMSSNDLPQMFRRFIRDKRTSNDNSNYIWSLVLKNCF